MTIDGDFQPLAWEKEHQARFSIVSFLACQILGISRSQIEMKRVFFVARVLCALRMCMLGTENLDVLVIIYKNC